MPRSGSGTYILPAGNPVSPGTTIQSGWANGTLADIATALTQSLAYDGQTVPVANIPLGGFKLTNVGPATNRNEYGTAGQIQDSALINLSSVIGSDTITANVIPALTTYTVGQTFLLLATATNTTNTVTININGLGAKPVTKLGATALDVGDILAGSIYRLTYDGTRFQISNFYNPQPSGFRNLVINGQFNIWQRGTSSGAAAGVGRFLADRFLVNSTGTTVAISQQAFAVGQTQVPFNPIFFNRCVVASVAGAGNNAAFGTRLEDVRNFSSVRCTLSFWAKADSNKNIAVEFTQFFGSGGSTQVDSLGVTTCPLTINWQRFVVTVDFPTIAGKTVGAGSFSAINFWMDAGATFNGRTNSLGQQSGTFDIANVQFEYGSFATAFEKKEVGAELAQCYRYYERGTSFLAGSVTTGVQVGYFVPFIVTKRITAVMTNLADSNSGVVPASNTYSAVSGRGFTVSAVATGTGAYFISTNWAADAEL